MTDGMMIIWFALTGLSVAFVAMDIRWTPESTVLKWAFVILTVFTGPFGAFFYVLGCREPLKGTHEEYVSLTWRQVLGSTMHCAAGDGLGIIAGAVIGSVMQLSPWADFILEYALGFGFGWAFFQAFAMRDMFGGSYSRSLRETFIPELVSMNLLMAGMVVVMKSLMPQIDGAGDPLQPAFWFVMSMALIAGFAMAYPMNWWLVVSNMKHGMLTVIAADQEQGDDDIEHSQHSDMAKQADQSTGEHDGHGNEQKPGATAILLVILFSFAILILGLWLAGSFF